MISFVFYCFWFLHAFTQLQLVHILMQFMISIILWCLLKTWTWSSTLWKKKSQIIATTIMENSFSLNKIRNVPPVAFWLHYSHASTHSLTHTHWHYWPATCILHFVEFDFTLVFVHLPPQLSPLWRFWNMFVTMFASDNARSESVQVPNTELHVATWATCRICATVRTLSWYVWVFVYVTRSPM